LSKKYVVGFAEEVFFRNKNQFRVKFQEDFSFSDLSMNMEIVYNSLPKILWLRP